MIPVRIWLTIYISQDIDFRDAKLLIDDGTIPNMYLKPDFGIKDALRSLVDKHIAGWKLVWSQFQHIVATEYRTDESWEIDIVYKLVLSDIPVSKGFLMPIEELNSINMNIREACQIRLSLSR